MYSISESFSSTCNKLAMSNHNCLSKPLLFFPALYAKSSNRSHRGCSCILARNSAFILLRMPNSCIEHCRKESSCRLFRARHALSRYLILSLSWYRLYCVSCVISLPNSANPANKFSYVVSSKVNNWLRSSIATVSTNSFSN